MKNSEQTTNTLFLAFSLACKHIAETSDKDAAWWSHELGRQAIELINNDAIHPNELEKLMQSIYPNVRE